MAWRIIRFILWSAAAVGWALITVDVWHGKYDWFAMMVGCAIVTMNLTLSAFNSLAGDPT